MAYFKVIVFNYYKIGHVVPIACMSLQGMFLICSKDDSEGRRCQAVLILSKASPSQVKP